MVCPVCGSGKLQKGKVFVTCSNVKQEQDSSGEWKDVGSCKFRIFFDQRKVYGDVLTPADVKSLVEGKILESKTGKRLKFNKNKPPFYTDILKEELEDL